VVHRHFPWCRFRARHTAAVGQNGKCEFSASTTESAGEPIMCVTGGQMSRCCTSLIKVIIINHSVSQLVWCCVPALGWLNAHPAKTPASATAVRANDMPGDGVAPVHESTAGVQSVSVVSRWWMSCCASGHSTRLACGSSVARTPFSFRSPSRARLHGAERAVERGGDFLVRATVKAEAPRRASGAAPAA
jgi:hypothetical protein